MRMPARLSTGALLSLLLLSAPVFAQAPPPPPPAGPLAASVTAGLALTSGNKDTSTLNLGYDLVYDPKTRNLVKSDGLFLRGKSEGESDRGPARAERSRRIQVARRDVRLRSAPVPARTSSRTSTTWSRRPVGLGYRIVDSDRTKLSVDAGLGGVWEKPPLSDVPELGRGHPRREADASALHVGHAEPVVLGTLQDQRLQRRPLCVRRVAGGLGDDADAAQGRSAGHLQERGRFRASRRMTSPSSSVWC